MAALIVEPSAEGHRLAWTRLLLDAATDVHAAVAQESADSDEFHHHLGDVDPARLHLLPSSTGRPATSWLAAVAFSRSSGFDHIVVQTFDDLDRQLGYEGFQTGAQQTAILMRGIPIPAGTSEARERQSRIDRLASSFHTGVFGRTLRLCAFSDPRVPTDPRHWLPDPPVLLSTVGALPRQHTQAAPYAVVAGQLAPRKRTHELISYWPTVYRSTGVRLVLAGRPEPGSEPDIADATHTAGEAVEFRPGHLSDLDLAALLASATCYVASYRDRYVPSGLVAHCIAVGTPVVSIGSTYIGQFARAAGGFHASDLSPAALAAGVLHALRNPEPAPQLTAGQDALANFAAAVLGGAVSGTPHVRAPRL